MKNYHGLITIAGAGPAGLTAAIILAKNGYDVRVFEQHSQVGSRFNDDFQGLENWSRKEDVLAELEKADIETNWWHRPFHGGIMYDAKMRPMNIKTSRPLFYMVRRGSAHPKSLDRSLLNQAKSAGAELVFNTRAKPDDVDIIAGGPTGRPLVVAMGMTFDTRHEDFACVFLNDELAPSGYTYFLISEGKATLANVLFKDFKDVHVTFQNSVETIKELFGIDDFANSTNWGGYGSFSIPNSCIVNGALLVGEAAGIQDFLFGFGIRYAMISGKLAAQSIIKKQNYDELWRDRLLPHLKASLVNRFIYNRFGNIAKRGLWYITGNISNPDNFMMWLYNFSPLHKLAYSFARRNLYKKVIR